MKTIERVLLAQRSDGKFLRLDEDVHTTSYDFVDEPELAKRVKLYGDTEEHLKSPRPAVDYFESSFRGRMWVDDCKMVAYEITTEIHAEVLHK